MGFRTPEQVEADEALTEALKRVNEAYYGETPFLITDYIVVYVEQSFDDEGDPLDNVAVQCRNGYIPPHKTLGLIDVARIQQELALKKSFDEGKP